MTRCLISALVAATKIFESTAFLGLRPLDFRRESAPAPQICAVFGDVRQGFFRVAEVRQEKARGLSRRDGVQRNIPRFEVDIRRWCERNDVRLAFDVETGRVADECGGVRGIEIGNVMRSVPRGVNHVEFAASESESFSAFEYAQIFKRNGQRFAKQASQFAGPKPLRAREQF